MCKGIFSCLVIVSAYRNMGSIRKFNASMAESMYGIYVDRKTFMTYTKNQVLIVR